MPVSLVSLTKYDDPLTSRDWGQSEIGVRALSSGGFAIEVTLRDGEPAVAIDAALAGPGPLTPATAGGEGSQVQKGGVQHNGPINGEKALRIDSAQDW